MNVKSIKTWNEEERPREKLMRQGPSSLSNSELLALIIKSGTRHGSAVDVARQILASCDGRLAALAREGPGKLTSIDGIGTAKATAIAATFELARRLASEIPAEDITVRSSKVVAKMMKPLLKDLPHEEFWVIYLNRGAKIIGKERLSHGGTASTVVDLKIIVKKAVDNLASAIILVHNHPSGNPRPGEQDIIQTEAIKKAAAVLDIAVTDHVIIGKKTYYSFADDVPSRL